MSLFEHLKLIEDPRSHINLDHDLVDIIFLVLAAIASGCDGWQAIEEFGNENLSWLRKHRDFDNGIPKVAFCKQSHPFELIKKYNLRYIHIVLYSKVHF